MQITYTILSLKEAEFRLNYDYETEDKESSNFEFFHREKADFTNRTIIIEVGARIISNNNLVLSENNIRGVFTLEPFENVITRGEDENSFQTTVPELINTFINITLGALRGIFAKNLAGTYLDGCVMPLIPMSSFAKTPEKKDKKASTNK